MVSVEKWVWRMRTRRVDLRHRAQEGHRIVQVVQQAATERGVETAVALEVVHVVTREAQIRQAELPRTELAPVHVGLPAVDPEGVEAGLGEQGGVATFETPEIDHRELARAPAREEGVERVEHRLGEGVLFEQDLAGNAHGPVGQHHVVGAERHHRGRLGHTHAR